MLEKCLDKCREHKFNGEDTPCTFSFKEKADAVRVANHIRSEFDCYVQQVSKLFLVVLL